MVQACDIELLRNSGVSEDDNVHSVKVAEKALEIAARTSKKLDMELDGARCFMIWAKPRPMRLNTANWGLKWGWLWACPRL